MTTHRDYRRARSAEAAIQLEEEQRIGELAGRVTPGPTLAFLGVEIVPIDLCAPMGNA
jgi:hypothetical protein